MRGLDEPVRHRLLELFLGDVAVPVDVKLEEELRRGLQVEGLPVLPFLDQNVVFGAWP